MPPRPPVLRGGRLKGVRLPDNPWPRFPSFRTYWLNTGKTRTPVQSIARRIYANQNINGLYSIRPAEARCASLRSGDRSNLLPGRRPGAGPDGSQFATRPRQRLLGWVLADPGGNRGPQYQQPVCGDSGVFGGATCVGGQIRARSVDP